MTYCLTKLHHCREVDNFNPKRKVCHVRASHINNNNNVIYLPTQHQRVHKNSFRIDLCIPGLKLNLEMMVFEERGKLEYPEKNLSEQRREPKQTQPTYDTGSGNQTQDTLVGDEHSQHCTNPLLVRGKWGFL